MDAQQAQNTQVLDGLGHEALVGGHHQHGKVDTAGAGQHVLDKFLMAGHVHDAEPFAVGHVRPGETQFDGDAAPFFLFEAIAVNARQRPYQRRFAVIDIPDYTPDEKKIIFSRFALPKVLKRMGLQESECVIAGDALDAVIEKYVDTTGIRDLEQAAEHLAANALYQIEVNHVAKVVFDREMVHSVLA